MKLVITGHCLIPSLSHEYPPFHHDWSKLHEPGRARVDHAILCKDMGEGKCLPFESWTIKWKITAVRNHLSHHTKGPVGKTEERKEKSNDIIWAPVEGFPGCSVVKNLSANAGDVGSIPGSGRSPRDRKGYPLQCSCLGNPMDEGSWWVIVHGVTRVRHNLAPRPPPLDSLGAPLPAPPWNFQLQEPKNRTLLKLFGVSDICL